MWDRFQALFRSYKPNDPTGFAADYRTAIYQATKSGALTEEQQLALHRTRKFIESWGRQDKALGDDVLREWLTLRLELANVVPVALIDTLLSKFPKETKSSITWSIHFGQGIPTDAVESLLEQKVMKTSDIVAYAKQNPGAFFLSPELDVLLEHETAPPRRMWDVLSQQSWEMPKLASVASAVARTFAVDKAADAASWLIQILTEHEVLRGPALELVLRNTVSTEKLIRVLVAGPEYMTIGPKAAPASSASLLLDALVAAIEANLDTTGHLESHLVWALGMIGLGTRLPSKVLSPSVNVRVEALLGRVAQAELPSVLRQHDRGLPASESLIVVQTSHLAEIIRTYLNALPISGNTESSSMDRATRYQRFLGQREVLQEMLMALAADGSDGGLRQALEVSLFNLGVRPIEEIGSTIFFQPSHHEAKEEGVVAGDRVRVVSAGARLGVEANSLVLRKAGVILDRN